MLPLHAPQSTPEHGFDFECNEAEVPWIPWHAALPVLDPPNLCTASGQQQSKHFLLYQDRSVSPENRTIVAASWVLSRAVQQLLHPFVCGCLSGPISTYFWCPNMSKPQPPRTKKTPVHVRCCQGHAGEKFQQQPRDASLTCSALASEISRRLLDGWGWHFLSMPLPLCRGVWDAKIDLNCKVQRRQVPSSSEEIGDVCLALLCLWLSLTFNFISSEFWTSFRVMKGQSLPPAGSPAQRHVPCTQPSPGTGLCLQVQVLKAMIHDFCRPGKHGEWGKNLRKSPNQGSPKFTKNA